MYIDELRIAVSHSPMTAAKRSENRSLLYVSIKRGQLLTCLVRAGPKLIVEPDVTGSDLKLHGLLKLLQNS